MSAYTVELPTWMREAMLTGTRASRYVVVLAACCVFFVLGCAPDSTRDVTKVSAGLRPGMPRSAVYEYLKSQHRVGFNINYVRYQSTGPRSSVLIENSDEWPEPKEKMDYIEIDGHILIAGTNTPELPLDVDHPFVEVKFIVGYSGLLCEDDVYLKILFDKNDLVSDVEQFAKPDCSAP